MGLSIGFERDVRERRESFWPCMGGNREEEIGQRLERRTRGQSVQTEAGARAVRVAEKIEGEVVAKGVQTALAVGILPRLLLSTHALASGAQTSCTNTQQQLH